MGAGLAAVYYFFISKNSVAGTPSNQETISETDQSLNTTAQSIINQMSGGS